jgi:hypothetical protein
MFVGAFVGTFVGATVGTLVGATVGTFVGDNVGRAVGARVCAAVGAVVVPPTHVHEISNPSSSVDSSDVALKQTSISIKKLQRNRELIDLLQYKGWDRLRSGRLV